MAADCIALGSDTLTLLPSSRRQVAILIDASTGAIATHGMEACALTTSPRIASPSQLTLVKSPTQNHEPLYHCG